MASKSVVTVHRLHPSDLPIFVGKNGIELIGVIRMWDGGPLRQFSRAQASSHYVGYSGPFKTGYAGSYICDRCQGASAGVYLATEAHKWLCGPCKDQNRRSGHLL
jgi:hypothetical protein